MLHLAAASIGADEDAAMTARGYWQAFMAFVAGLLAGADRYLQRGDIGPLRDGADYRMAGLWACAGPPRRRSHRMPGFEA